MYVVGTHASSCPIEHLEVFIVQSNVLSYVQLVAFFKIVSVN